MGAVTKRKAVQHGSRGLRIRIGRKVEDILDGSGRVKVFMSAGALYLCKPIATAPDQYSLEVGERALMANSGGVWLTIPAMWVAQQKLEKGSILRVSDEENSTIVITREV